MKGQNFPFSTLREIFKEAGAKKVSEDALKELHKHLTSTSEKIIMRASTISKIKKNESVTGSDIRMAVREFYGIKKRRS